MIDLTRYGIVPDKYTWPAGTIANSQPPAYTRFRIRNRDRALLINEAVIVVIDGQHFGAIRTFVTRRMRVEHLNPPLPRHDSAQGRRAPCLKRNIIRPKFIQSVFSGPTRHRSNSQNSTRMWLFLSWAHRPSVRQLCTGTTTGKCATWHAPGPQIPGYILSVDTTGRLLCWNATY